MARKPAKNNSSTANLGFEADRVDYMVALPGQLFHSTQIPVCLWFLAKNKTKPASNLATVLRKT